MIRIVIIDSQDSERSNLALILSAQNDFQVVGMGKDGYDALKLAEQCNPDILVLDINLSYIDGVQATSILKCRSPHTCIIIRTLIDDAKSALKAMCNGASGYLLKSADGEKLAEEIRTINNGGCLMTPHLAARVFPLVSQLVGPSGTTQLVQPPTQPFPFNLSRTELKIIHYIGRGLKNREIAAKLCLCIGTIRNYISVILQKTMLRNRTQIAIFAGQYKL
jgi:DNA-binding NarL/FixJ family response regulator